MSDRRFGVEIEFGSNGIGRTGVLETLRNAFTENNLRHWWFDDRLGHDGSEFELKTPILRGEDGFKKLKVVMNSLIDAGCYTSGEDGLHVHHDAPEFIGNIDACIKLVKSWQNNKHLIYQFVEPYRVENEYDYCDYCDGPVEDCSCGEGPGYWACPQWTTKELKLLEENKSIPTYTRKDLNLLALSEHGSIEIRLHEGTLDFEQAEAWIKFGQQFIENCIEHSIYDSKEPSNLMRKISVDPSAQKVLINKAERLRRRAY